MSFDLKMQGRNKLGTFALALAPVTFLVAFLAFCWHVGNRRLNIS